MKSESKDALIVTVPKVDLKAPLVGPAIMKSAAANHGFEVEIFDLNLHLWNRVPEEIRCMWLDTDLVFLEDQKFRSIWEKHFEPLCMEWISTFFRDRDFRWIGASVFSQRSEVFTKYFVRLLRQQIPQCQRVLGGAHVTEGNWVDELLADGNIDAYVYGEGEVSFVELLKGTEEFPGISNKNPTQLENLDEVPVPDYTDLDMREYPLHWKNPETDYEPGGDNLYINSARGCVRKCNFCNVSKLFPLYRYKSGRLVAHEIAELQQRHPSVNTFVFTNSLINGSMTQLREMCREIISMKKQGLFKHLRWEGHFIVRGPQSMKPEDFDLMYKSGCRQLALGLESGSEQLRAVMNKKFTNAELLYNLEQFERCGISVNLMMLIGYYAETQTTFQENLEFFKTLKPFSKSGTISDVTLGSTLVIVPGVPLYERARELGIQWDETGNWYCGDNSRKKRVEQYMIFRDYLIEHEFRLLEKDSTQLENEYEHYFGRPYTGNWQVSL